MGAVGGTKFGYQIFHIACSAMASNDSTNQSLELQLSTIISLYYFSIIRFLEQFHQVPNKKRNISIKIHYLSYIKYLIHWITQI